MQCLHCGTRIPEGMTSAYCCAGCEAVHQLIEKEGLSRFYALAGDRVAPAPLALASPSLAWLEPLLETGASAVGEVAVLTLDVQGIQCAACVWLLNQLFGRMPGAVRLVVNAGVGRMELFYRRGSFDVPAFVRRVESFGYRLGPALKSATQGGLTLRLGVCAAITVNVMLFSLSFYLGLSPKEGELYWLFSTLSLGLSTVAVVVGGWPFFLGAVRGLKERVLHLDLPVALGIALVFSLSLLQARDGGGVLYLDTLSAFITLMLLGRWIQRRVVEQNRSFLLEDAGLNGLWCRRVEGAALKVVPAAAVRPGDSLVLAPGELLPIDGRVDDVAARVSLEWISGESAPTVLGTGSVIPAGAFNAGDGAARVTVLKALDSTRLPALLARKEPGRAADGFWNQLARGWASRVLAVAAFGFVLWLPKGLDSALSVAAALLVVTCPCAIGLAIPLAYELTQARLKRLGLYARTDDLLDRLRHVRKVIFDKTGTLTLSRLELEHLPTLTEIQRDAAYNLACRSAHPVAACIARELAAQGARFDAGFDAVERAGEGMRAGRWTLGRRATASGSVLALDDQPVATFEVREQLRSGASAQVRRLSDEGYEVWLASGDDAEKVGALATRLGIAPQRTRSRQSPEQKAELVGTLDQRDTLFLGDGVNDALAFSAAFCAGSPAVEGSLMPSRASFFMVGEGLEALHQGLAAAHRLHRVVRTIVGLSLAYNVLAVSAGLLGWITPLRAAVFMPLSSLSLLLFALWSLRGSRTGGAAWKEAAA